MFDHWGLSSAFFYLGLYFEPYLFDKAKQGIQMHRQCHLKRIKAIMVSLLQEFGLVGHEWVSDVACEREHGGCPFAARRCFGSVSEHTKVSDVGVAFANHLEDVSVIVLQVTVSLVGAQVLVESKVCHAEV